MDDAAVLPSRPGFDLVISTDSMVESVHFLPGEAMDIVARRLLRTSLSDLAAKAAEPFGYFLNIAWPARFDDANRNRFIEGLNEDGRTFQVILLGGDTVSTTGPLTMSATVLGWVPAGKMVRRNGARSGDICLVCGQIGDGWLGLRAARGEIDDPSGLLRSRYRLPEPKIAIVSALRRHASAAADVSDGLLADASHIAEASGLGLDLDLEMLPLSEQAQEWLTGQSNQSEARLSLATGGDDYAVVCATAADAVTEFIASLALDGVRGTVIGAFSERFGLRAFASGSALDVLSSGWRH